MISFVGDMIFGDQPVLFGFGFDSNWKEKGYQGIFDNVAQEFKKSNYVIANFESIIRERSDDYAINEWSMCCDERIAKVMKKASISIVSIANNHIYDFGEKAFFSTILYLKNEGIQIIGLKDKPYVKINDNEKKIAIIASSYVGKYNKDEIGIFYRPTQEEWKKTCYECRDCDEVIAYLHWGNEYITNPTEEQVSIAQEVFDAGVDIIIGHHPHILQNAYLINKKKVIFSLGNFVSDYWQTRLRKTMILHYNSSMKEFHTVNCIINDKGIPNLEGKSSVTEFEHKQMIVSTNEDIAKARFIVRKEILLNIFKNGHKFRYKYKFIKWVFKRLVYFLCYGRKEKANPNIIYEKYK